MHENPISKTRDLIVDCPGREQSGGQRQGRKVRMNGGEESDGVVVPMKQANKATEDSSHASEASTHRDPIPLSRFKYGSPRFSRCLARRVSFTRPVPHPSPAMQPVTLATAKLMPWKGIGVKDPERPCYADLETR